MYKSQRFDWFEILVFKIMYSVTNNSRNNQHTKKMWLIMQIKI